MPDHDAGALAARPSSASRSSTRRLRRSRRTDEIERLQQQLEQAARPDRTSRRRPRRPASRRGPGAIMDEGVVPFLEWRPPGHYYSPIPSMNEIEAQEDRIFGRPDHLEGFDLNEDAQRALLETLAPLMNDVHLQRRPAARQPVFHQQPLVRPRRRLHPAGLPAPPAPGSATSRSVQAGPPRSRSTRTTAGSTADCASPALSRTPTICSRLRAAGRRRRDHRQPGAGRRPRALHGRSSRATSSSSTARTSSRRAATPIT